MGSGPGPGGGVAVLVALSLGDWREVCRASPCCAADGSVAALRVCVAGCARRWRRIPVTLARAPGHTLTITVNHGLITVACTITATCTTVPIQAMSSSLKTNL